MSRSIDDLKNFVDQLPARSAKEVQTKAVVSASLTVLGEALGDLRRCADALEVLAGTRARDEMPRA